MRRRVLLVASIPLVVACGSSSRDAASTGQGGETLTFTTPAFTVPPGDSFECFYTDVKTDHELSVNGADGQQGKGGHHIIVYWTETAQPVGHHPCTDAEMVTWHQVAGSAGVKGGGAEGIISLPPGYAVKIPAGKQIVTQSHYINTTADAMQVSDTVTLNLLEPSQVTAYANALAMSDGDFKVPPVSAFTHGKTCTLKRDFSMLLLLGHMHEHGQHYKLEQLDEAGQNARTLYEQDWAPAYASHPPVTHYDPSSPLVLKAGTKLRETCTWNNETADALAFPREMCAMFGYYFPDDAGMVVCDDD